MGTREISHSGIANEIDPDTRISLSILHKSVSVVVRRRQSQRSNPTSNTWMEVKGEESDTVSSGRPSPSPSACSRQSLKIQDYSDRVSGTYLASTRQFTVSCKSDARQDGIVRGLKVYLAISSDPSNCNQDKSGYQLHSRTRTQEKSRLGPAENLICMANYRLLVQM